MHLPILTFLQVVPVSACLQNKKGSKAGCQRKRCLLASSFSDSAPGMKWRRPVICGSVVADPGSVVKTKPESSGFAVSAWSITSHTEGLQTAFHKKRTLFNPVGSLPCIGYTFGGSNFKSSKPVQCVCAFECTCVCVCVPDLEMAFAVQMHTTQAHDPWQALGKAAVYDFQQQQLSSSIKPVQKSSHDVLSASLGCRRFSFSFGKGFVLHRQQ